MKKQKYYYKVSEGEAWDFVTEKIFWSYKELTDIQFKHLVLNNVSLLRLNNKPVNMQTLIKSLILDDFFPIIINGIADVEYLEGVKTVADIYGDVEELNS